MSEWEKTNLGKISKDITYGYTESASLEPIGPKFLRITDIQEDHIDWDLVPYCKISQSDYKRYRLKKGDAVVARTGNSTGATAVIKEDVEGVFASYLIRFKLNLEKVSYCFIDFLLRSRQWSDYVKMIKCGTAQGGANAKQFADFPIVLPPLPEQELIANLLLSIDNKKRILEKQNELSSKLIETVFKQWFFEFGYPGDKGKRIDSEIGEIPEGWKFCQIGEIIERITERIGKDDQSKYAVLSAVKTGELILSGDYFSKQVFSKDLSKYIRLEKDDFAYNPARINIGSIGKVEDDIKGAVSPVYVAFRAKNKFINFVSLFIKTARAKKHIELFANGSVRQSLSFDDFASMEIVKPSDDVMKLFNETYGAVFKKITTNNQQIGTLKKMLDTLLPKLMSGEVRVK